jgi:hypothetical protein
MISREQYKTITDIASFVSPHYIEDVKPQQPEPVEQQKQRSAFWNLIAEGLTFGLYDPHFTREEMEKSVLFAKIPIKEKILDKIPVVKQIADIFLPYDVSVASLLQWLTLGGALRIFGKIGGGVARAVRLESPLLKASSPIARRLAKVFTVVPEGEAKFVAEKVGKGYKLIPEEVFRATKLWQNRIYNSIATGLGVGVGEGIKGLYEASQGKRDWGEALTNFAIAPFVNSLFFPLIDVGFEGLLRKTFFNPRRLLTKSEQELIEGEIKSSNKTSPAGEQLANTIEKRTEENLTEMFAKAFETNKLDEALKSVASSELLSKLEKVGITKITFSHFEDVNQIANESLRAAVNIGLRNQDYIKNIKDASFRQIVENFVNHFKFLQRQEIAKAGMTLGKLFDELRVEPEIKSLLPADLKDKPFKQMTIDEKQRAMEIINQNTPYLRIEINKPEVLEKLDAFVGQLRDVVQKSQGNVARLITEYLDKLTPEQRKEFWRKMIPDLTGSTLRFSNESLSYLYHLTGEKPEKLIKQDRERLMEMLAEGKLLPAYVNQLAKQTKVIFDLDDKGELLIDVLSNISREGNAKRHLSVLEEGFKNATYSQMAEFERKKNLMWEDPLIESLQEIVSGKREIPEGASKEQVISQIQERITNRKLDPAKWIVNERIPVLGNDYDIWTLAADAYRVSGKDVGEVVSALEQHYTKGKFDEKVFESAFKVFSAKYPLIREIGKSSKTPTEKMVKLLEYLKNEKDKFEFAQKDILSFSQEKTVQETINKIEATNENVRTHIHEKVKEKFFAPEAFEKIPNELLDLYKEAENKDDFKRKIDRISDEKILDYFVAGGKYGLKELPKEGDKIFLLRPGIFNRAVEFYVEKIRKWGSGEVNVVVKPVREADRKFTIGMALTPEQLSLYSFLAEAKKADSFSDALYKAISKYSLKNPKVAESKGVKLNKISLKEALRMVGYEPNPVDEILTGKRKMRIPEDTWEDWKLLFGKDFKKFGTKDPRFESADSLATEYGFEGEEEFKNYLADRLEFLKKLREEAKKFRDNYEFNEEVIELPSETQKETISIPKELEPLAKEAMKYKSAEEFARKVFNISSKEVEELEGMIKERIAREKKIIENPHEHLLKEEASYAQAVKDIEELKKLLQTKKDLSSKEREQILKAIQKNERFIEGMKKDAVDWAKRELKRLQKKKIIYSTSNLPILEQHGFKNLAEFYNYITKEIEQPTKTLEDVSKTLEDISEWIQL